MKEKWNSYSVQGNIVRKLKKKLNLLKYDLKTQNHEVCGIMDTTKKIIIREIEDLDRKDDISELRDNLKLKRMELVS